MPMDLIGQRNGKLPMDLLSVFPESDPEHHQLLHPFVFDAFRLMRQDMLDETGLRLSMTDGYRPYSEQEHIFRERYTTNIAKAARINGKYKEVKFWLGTTWYILAGVASAANPGSSNHGWGLAIDLALLDDKGNRYGVDDNYAALDWLINNAGHYGFSWEIQSEPWHIRYVLGVPLPTEIAVIPNLEEQDDMMLFIHAPFQRPGEDNVLDFVFVPQSTEFGVRLTSQLILRSPTAKSVTYYVWHAGYSGDGPGAVRKGPYQTNEDRRPNLHNILHSGMVSIELVDTHRDEVQAFIRESWIKG